MRPSLRRRLLVLLLAAVLLAWAATAAFTYLDARHEIGAMLDARLAQSAELIAVQIDHLEGDGDEPYLLREVEATTLQVWRRDGGLLLRSLDAPHSRLSEHDEGFADVAIADRTYRVYSLWDEGRRFNVQVAERKELRAALAESVASHLLHPLYFAVPGLGLLIWLSVGIGLAPLGRFAREVARRAPDNLAPLEEQRTPREVLPLQVALNTLFTRLRASLELERRFTADAAHELRTPLAAIKVQAQVAAAAHDVGERERALANVVTGADRAAHLVEQLLVLARLDPQKTLVKTQTVSLPALVSECVAAQATVAAGKGVEIGVDAAEAGNVVGDPVLLEILVRNLVDNAVRYTPSGGKADVRVLQSNSAVILRVTDTGPGIPAALREQVFERFYRLLGSGEQGSGLGLSIAKRIADLHRATIALEGGPSGHGLVLTVSFPQGAADQEPRRAGPTMQGGDRRRPRRNGS